MAPILSTLVFATAATAQLTTSIWMPSPYQDDTHIGFLASVVGVSDGKTTLALHFDNSTDLKTAGYAIDHTPNTMTFGPNGFEAVSTIAASNDEPESTVTYGCELTSTKAAKADGVCSFVSDSPTLYKSKCLSYSDDTDVPDYCKSGSVLPASVRAHTYAIEQEDIATYQVLVTAGLEKLSATAGATPATSFAIPTATGSFTLQRGQNTLPTGAAEAAGAAGAILPLHPALAGLGAAAMAFLL